MALFRNRSDAGRELAAHLLAYSDMPNAIVLALPRGGVAVGYEVARALRLPLDVYIVRKLGVPGHEELAMGAIAADGSCVLDDMTLEFAHIDAAAVEETVKREQAELHRRSIAYRDDRPEPSIENRTVLLVDDGLATGASMYAALGALRSRNPAEIAVAVPVAPADSVDWLRGVADRVICPHQFDRFGAVGLYYDDFSQVTDDEVRETLARAEKDRKSWSIA